MSKEKDMNHVINLLGSDDNVNNVAELKEYIKDNKIDVNDDDYNLWVVAAYKGKVKYLELLIKEGLDIDNYIDEILAHAAQRGHEECTKFALDNGANIKNLIGSSAYNTYPEMRKYLDRYQKEIAEQSCDKKNGTVKKDFRQEVMKSKNVSDKSR